ncbi:MAG: MFS transporter [Candidatus Bathyarchaeia archaeon]|nr:MFS transporter [Candidatus Bathyarchaeota archaeon]
MGYESTKNSTDKSQASKELLLIFILTFLFFTGYNMILPILPIYIVSIGASKLELGFIMATIPATSIIARIPFGILMDKVGRWSITLLALTLQLFAYIMFSLTPPVHTLYLTAVVYALAISSFGPSVIAIALDAAPLGSKGSVMGRFYASIGASMVLGPLITSLLTYNYTYQTVFTFTLTLPAVGLAALLTFRGFSIKPARSGVSSIQDRPVISSLKRIILQRNILLLSAASVTFFISLGVFETMFPIYVKEDLALETYYVGLLFAVRGVPNAFSRIPAGIMADRIGRRIPLIISYSLTFTALFILPTAKNIYLLMLLIGLYGFAWGARTAPSAALYSDNVSSLDTGFVSTIIWLTSDVAMALGSSLAGALTMFFSIPQIIMLSSILLLPGLFLILMISESKNRVS